MEFARRCPTSWAAAIPTPYPDIAERGWGIPNGDILPFGRSLGYLGNCVESHGESGSWPLMLVRTRPEPIDTSLPSIEEIEAELSRDLGEEDQPCEAREGHIRVRDSPPAESEIILRKSVSEGPKQ